MTCRRTNTRRSPWIRHSLTVTLMVGVTVGGSACSRSAPRANAGESATTTSTDAVGSADTMAGSVDSSATTATGVDTTAPVGNPPEHAATPPSPPDTARGVVQRVGADPVSSLLLVPRDNAAGEAVVLVSASPSTLSSAELSATEGLEVMVRGIRTSERASTAGPKGAPIFRVTQFAVRAADGVTARDGILVQVNGQWMLEALDGSRSGIVSLPAALQSQRGARVFLAGPATQAPQSFGILRAK